MDLPRDIIWLNDEECIEMKKKKKKEKIKKIKIKNIKIKNIKIKKEIIIKDTISAILEYDAFMDE